jgi:flagellar motor protein MotB
MEKRIKSYKEFFESSKINEEESLKDWAVGTAMAASALNPFSKAMAADAPVDSSGKTSIETSYQAPQEKEADTFHFGKDKPKSHTTVKTGTEAARKKQADRLVNQGWTLDSTSVDTLWREILVQKPDTIVTKHDFKFDVEGDMFLTGKFTLNQSVVNGINDAVEQIQSEGGVVTDFQIESSTDKEPINMEYEGMTGNEALAHRRADAVEDELIRIGVDDSIISIVTKPDQGPDVYTKNMNKDERTAARMETAASRYVTIGIVYITKDVVYTPEIIEKIPKIKTIYYLSKDTEVVNPPRRKSHFKNKKTHTKIKHTKRENRATRCASWNGSKDAWWFHLGQ